MALTIGTGPFGRQAAGVFNFTRRGPDAVLYVEDSPRRVQVEFAGDIVADTTRAKLLHETELLPVYYFPVDDVRMELLEGTDHRTHCPYKGEARYFSIHVGERRSENAAWEYPQPIASAPPLADHLAFYWHKVDHWYEEDEEIFVHAPDPYHRVDVRHSSRRVRVELGGETVAESARTVMLFETGLPPRFYLPPDDAREEMLVPSESHTQCPYKGVASYWSVLAGGEVHPDLLWYYPDPLAGMEKIAGRYAFYNERVDITVDGERQERPVTRFS